MSESVHFSPTEPFDVPPLPPTHDIETVPVLKRLTPAARALSALNQVARLLDDQQLLINLIPILESKSSSEVENIVTTTDELFRYREEDEDASSPAVKETMRYKKALFAGFLSITAKDARPLTANTAMDICAELTDRQVDVRKVTETNLKNSRTGEIIYTPPVGENNLRDKLGNWEKFLHENELDPLLAMAVMHYQFEAIHPFLDGNGRTGRILNILYMVEKSLLNQPILYLSRFIVQNKDEYYRLLLNVSQRGEWEPWICFMLDAIKITSQWTIDKVNVVIRLRDLTADHIKTVAPESYSMEMISLLFKKPYIRGNDLVNEGLYKSRQGAMTCLDRLVDAKVLTSQKRGRQRIFVHTRLRFLMEHDINEFEPF